MRVESDENLRRASIGNDVGCVAQSERVVIILEDLEAVTEPVQLCGHWCQAFQINGKVRGGTYVVAIRIVASWVVPIDEDDLNKWLEMNAIDFTGELTVKLAVALFFSLNGPVEFASATSEPLIEMVGATETLVAGRAAPVVGTTPE